MKGQHKDTLNNILELLGSELDISNSEYEAAVKSYKAVAEQLTKENSELIPYEPEILPQGSFMLGTMIKPINENDDLDIDLVCQLTSKNTNWTQLDLKQKVGDQLKLNSTYERMLKKPEGRRCWTLVYAEGANYHLDILPSIVDSGYKLLFEKKFIASEFENTDELAIRITDREDNGYKTEMNHLAWLKSNPFGYAKWFFKKAIVSSTRLFSLNEAIQPIRDFDKEKLPLQRIVQILKRHRDIMFCDKSDYNLDHKPISIIITTLAATTYNRESNILDGLISVVGHMRSEIKERWNDETLKYDKWVENPVNYVENFADKWSDEDLKREYFYLWLAKLEEDIASLINSEGIGLNNLQKSMSSQFGDNLTENVFVNYGNKNRILTENGKRSMELGSGLIGTTSVGPKVRKHDFEGLV